MKVLHLSTSDIEGGAARASYRLHRGLEELGLSSEILVHTRQSADPNVVVERSLQTKLAPRLDSFPLGLYKKRDRTLFSPQWFPDKLDSQVDQMNPDIVILHWICNGFLQIETLPKFKKPLVWLLHDMWPFTGGCHYSQDCDRFTNSCGACPQLHSQQNHDLSHWIFRRKAKAWKNLDLTIVAPSNWMADIARSSALFQNRLVTVIPHGMDTKIYKPISRQVARDLLNLPQNKQLVLFGAFSGATSDPRKGFQFLQLALKSLQQNGWQECLETVVIGANRLDSPSDLGFKTHYLGRLQDDLTLALVYAAADVMVVPSMQEAFGQTASEALACGTPVVAFGATGLKDIIDHKHNGYLAEPFEFEDLAKGIAWVLEDHDRHHTLSLNARQKAEQEFSLERQAQRYLSLFHKVSNSVKTQLIGERGWQ